MSDVIWIADYGEQSPEIAYFTREPDGLSGMTPAALAQIVVVSTRQIESVYERIVNTSDSDKLSLPLPLRDYAGRKYNLAESDSYEGGYSMIIPDFLCQAIIETYTSHSKDYPGKQQAIENKSVLLSGAVRVFIWSKTKYQFRVEGSYWNKRISIALSSSSRPVPKNYFSIYGQMMDLFRELETRFNYIIPDINPEKDQYLIPDISIGQMFNSFLRSEEESDKKVRLEYLGSDEPVDFRVGYKNNSEIEYYYHIYPEDSHGKNNKQTANAYPIRYIGIFTYYFNNRWIPERFPSYIKQRDNQGYRYLESRVKNLSSGEVSILRTTILQDVIDLFRPRIDASD